VVAVNEDGIEGSVLSDGFDDGWILAATNNQLRAIAITIEI
jgi:hypothetical protein